MKDDFHNMLPTLRPLQMLVLLWVTLFGGVHLGGCGPELKTPAPGDPANLMGIWFGLGTLEGDSYTVILYLEHRGSRISGSIFHWLTGDDLEGVKLPGGISFEHLPSIRPGDECGLSQGEVTDQVLYLRAPTRYGPEIMAQLAYDRAKEQLRGAWGLDTELADVSGEVTLHRIAWDPLGFFNPGCEPRGASRCRDGLDNDGDGLIDMEDPACELLGLFGEAVKPPCLDGWDNDGDGLIDMEDLECSYTFDHERSMDPECGDGWDNDRDGLIDLDDPDCGGDRAGHREAPDACADGLDNDQDGLTDEMDPQCANSNREDPGSPACQNGTDDDGDGLIDLDDPQCAPSLGLNSEHSSWSCEDGLDNDGDGLTDLEDPGCEGDPYGEELPPLPAVTVGGGPLDQLYNYCANGLDDDGDGLIDLDDPSCRLWLAMPDQRGTRSFESLPHCIDGVDNDGDGLADLLDPDCDSRFDASERPDCDNGLDDDGDGLIDLADPGCGGDPLSIELKPACADGVDNDGDGLIDLADPGCRSPVDNTEHAACADHLDNDGDGLIDLGDPQCAGPQDDDEAR